MGMFTKINIILKIKNDAPLNVKTILMNMFDGADLTELEELIDLPDHDFFKVGSRVWFPNSGGSYYFTGTANSAIKFRSVDNQMVLHIDTDFKNYADEIKHFLDWIAPYVDADENEFLGYSRYEEDYNPTLYFFKNKEIVSFMNENV